MINIWRQLRFAGLVVMCAGSWMPNVQLVLIGLFVFLMGIIHGLTFVERRLELLEKERTNENSSH